VVYVSLTDEIRKWFHFGKKIMLEIISGEKVEDVNFK